jgi:single-strand selective monofunctional uracil DNA glycosylase
MDRAETLVAIVRALRDDVDALTFGSPVHFVYNPLVYAWDAHCDYLRIQGTEKGRTLLLGMNPGPFGMAQTGVPFGEVAHVRDWLGVQGEIGKPSREHPKRLVLGWESPRSEVSGRRLWGWAAERYGTAEAFFSQFIVVNYCPLAFLEETGRNRTPDKLSVKERTLLLDRCDRALSQRVELLEPSRVVGVGAWAERCARRVVGATVPVGRILHPSPASPAANRGWAHQAEEQLTALGLRLPDREV